MCLEIIQTVSFKKLVYNANYCVTYKEGIPKICSEEGRVKAYTIMSFLEKILLVFMYCLFLHKPRNTPFSL